MHLQVTAQDSCCSSKAGSIDSLRALRSRLFRGPPDHLIFILYCWLPTFSGRYSARSYVVYVWWYPMRTTSLFDLGEQIPPDPNPNPDLKPNAIE